CTDVTYMEGAFTKFFRNRGRRVSQPDKIAKLEHVNIDRARLASPYVEKSKVATHIVETDFSFDSIRSLTEMNVYKMFDFRSPFAEATSMLYANKYSFGSEFYTVPSIYGSLEWLRRSTAIPLILKALSKNSINIK